MKMQTKAFSIYDVKAEIYSPPFFVNTVGLAIRMFTDLVNDGESRIAKYPADFTLFEIGSFDDSSGTVTPRDANLPLGGALEFVNQERGTPPWQDPNKSNGQAIASAK